MTDIGKATANFVYSVQTISASYHYTGQVVCHFWVGWERVAYAIVSAPDTCVSALSPILMKSPIRTSGRLRGLVRYTGIFVFNANAEGSSQVLACVCYGCVLGSYASVTGFQVEIFSSRTNMTYCLKRHLSDCDLGMDDQVSGVFVFPRDALCSASHHVSQWPR